MLQLTVFELPRPETPGKFSFQEINYGQPICLAIISSTFREEIFKKKPASTYRPAPLTEKQNNSVYQRPRVSF